MKTRRTPRNQERLWRELGGVKRKSKRRRRLPQRQRFTPEQKAFIAQFCQH